MARLIRVEGTGPIKIDPSTFPPGKMISICACGLSQNLPFCDGAHKGCRDTEQPGKLYVYDKARMKIVEEREDA